MDHGCEIQPALTVGVDEAAMSERWSLVLLLEVLIDRMEDSFNFSMQNQKAHAEESNSKSIVDESPTDHIPLAWRNDHEYLSGRTYDIWRIHCIPRFYCFSYIVFTLIKRQHQ